MALEDAIGGAKTSTTSERVFVDSNVIVYAFDVLEARKREIALGIIDRGRRGNTIVSAQVLNETYWCLTRRLRTPLSGTAARDVVQALADGRVVPIEPSLVLRAIDRAQHSRLAYWEAPIVEAALGSSCRRLLTEDLQHGQRFVGLTVENPFRETPPP